MKRVRRFIVVTIGSIWILGLLAALGLGVSAQVSGPTREELALKNQIDNIKATSTFWEEKHKTATAELVLEKTKTNNLVSKITDMTAEHWRIQNTLTFTITDMRRTEADLYVALGNGK